MIINGIKTIKLMFELKAFNESAGRSNIADSSFEGINIILNTIKLKFKKLNNAIPETNFHPVLLSIDRTKINEKIK